MSGGNNYFICQNWNGVVSMNIMIKVCILFFAIPKNKVKIPDYLHSGSYAVIVS